MMGTFSDGSGGGGEGGEWSVGSGIPGLDKQLAHSDEELLQTTPTLPNRGPLIDPRILDLAQVHLQKDDTHVHREEA